jgi:hypothetical protein
MSASTLPLKVVGDYRPVPQMYSDKLSALKGYIRNAKFKELLNSIVQRQAESGFKSISVMSMDFETDKTLFISSLALAYTYYLQSRVLIVETVEQPTDRSLFMQSILGQHLPEGERSSYVEGGTIDFLSTDTFFDGERELADFHLGEYVRKVQSKYDLVLVDTAPLCRKDDDAIHPLIIGGYTDRTILVVRSQRKALKSINNSIQLLKMNRIPLLGIVEEGKANGRGR